LRQKFDDFLLNRIRLSAFDTRDKSLHKFTRRLRSFNPTYFYGYASLIYRYGQWLEEKKISLDGINPSVIITTGEVLYDFQRTLIQRVFRCRVANEYGSTEAGILAFECPNGNLHVNSDHIFLETVGKRGDPGSVLLTELNNDYSPLIRYHLGDMGVISTSNCGCGINFPVITNLIGREDSFIITPKNVHIYDAVIPYVLTKGVRQFRGIQDTKEELIIKIVKDNELTDFLLDTYRRRLIDILGDDLKITFEIVAEIEPDKSGKLRCFISNIKEEQ